MVSFTLTEFNSTVSMDVSGRFDASAAFILESSANAVLYVSTAAMQNTFRFATESTNFDDVSLNDVRYYVYKDNWTYFNDGSLNPVNAHLTGSDITTTNSAGGTLNDNEFLVKHDFLRYVAKRLFNTPYGVDLFSNEAALISNLNLKGGLASGILSDISGKLMACDVNGVSPTVATLADVNGNYYATDVQADATNICRELLRQLYHTAPNRFSELIDGDGQTIRKIPFVDADVINFKIIVNAATGQETITNVVPIPARTYTISLVLTSDPTDVNPVPAL